LCIWSDFHPRFQTTFFTFGFAEFFTLDFCFISAAKRFLTYRFVFLYIVSWGKKSQGLVGIKKDTPLQPQLVALH